MFKISAILFFLFASYAMPALAAIDVELWHTEKSQHFIVYYQEAPYGYVNNLTSRAEKYYSGILENLGYNRFDFWSWDNRAKIYLFRDAESYQAETQRFAWSGAVVEVKSRTIKTYVGQYGFFDSMLPHEMAHVIFREFVGERKDLPLWLDEGVACSQEESTLASRLEAARELVKNNQAHGISQLSKVWELSSIAPQEFYSQAASLVNFLLKKYGRNRFLDFSRQLRDGKEWQKALMGTYSFKSLEDFEEKWKQWSVR